MRIVWAFDRGALPERWDDALRVLEAGLEAELAALNDASPSPLAPAGEHIAYGLWAARLRAESDFLMFMHHARATNMPRPPEVTPFHESLLFRLTSFVSRERVALEEQRREIAAGVRKQPPQLAPDACLVLLDKLQAVIDSITPRS